MNRDSDVQATLSRLAEAVEYDGVPLKDVNQRGIFGNTPLHIAAIRGDLSAAQILIDAGADINARGEMGFTPLHEAVDHEHSPVVALLLDLGANRTLKNEDGETAADIALTSGNQQIYSLLRRGRASSD
jgi:ankyrin repeat protein